ncbi:MAG: hypothetical protein JHC33_13305, partial [Ignisphaera sp.]|nr:hypothetical protein [Ignisphaera sp.]
DNGTLRGKGEEAKARKSELIKAGIEVKCLYDFIEDVENRERGVCGDDERHDAYLEILSI